MNKPLFSQILFAGFLGATLLLLTSCATVGTRFADEDLPPLELRQTTRGQLVSRLGQPLVEISSSDAEGTLQTLRYGYETIDTFTYSTVEGRMLTATFRGAGNDARLVSYLLTRDKSQATRLQRVDSNFGQVAKGLSQSQVIALIGPPDGKSLLTEQIEGYEDLHMAWMYLVLRPEGARIIHIGFDRSGAVRKVERISAQI